MTTGLTYSTFKTQIATMAVVAEDDPAFLTTLPMAITYAENRIYREVDFLFTSISTTSYSLTTGSRIIAVPSGTFVVPEQINVITPVGTTNPNLGTRNPLLPTTKEFLDAVYGSYTDTAMPKYFCPFDDYLFYVGPFPDQSYTVEIVGTYRPQSLGPGAADTTFLTSYQTYTGAAYPNYASTTTTTFISLYLPELLIMASMIYISAFQRNFGRQSDDPAMAQSYESQYQTLLKGAITEEYRKKMQAAAWSSTSSSPVATPTR